LARVERHSDKINENAGSADSAVVERRDFMLCKAAMPDLTMLGGA